MPTHLPIIIPEIYDKNPICDYIPQTAKKLVEFDYPIVIFLLNYPAQKFTLPIFKPSEITYYYPQKLLPLNRFDFIRQIQIYLSFNFLSLFCRFKFKTKPIYWIFYPHLHNLIKHSIRPDQLIYDIIDLFPGYTSGKKYFLTPPHIVTAISKSLINVYQKILPSTKIHLVPQGFNLSSNDISLHPKINEIDNLKYKIGFIGAVNDRLDYQLLFKLISQTPRYQYIFIGPFGHDTNVSPKPIEKLSKKLFSFKNVYHIDVVPKSQIGLFINLFDIAIIPYDVNDNFNRLCYPMKLFEYFAVGIPVLSTPIEELKRFPNLVKIGDTPHKWQSYLDYFFSHPITLSQKNQAKKLAQDNSWKNKISRILKLLPQ